MLDIGQNIIYVSYKTS